MAMRLATTFIEVDTQSREPAETIHKAFCPIGSIDGAGTIAVSAFEAVIPTKQMVFRGVRFEVTGSGEFDRTGTVTVAQDNAEKLISSLDNMASSRIERQGFPMVEVETEVDGLRIIVFNMRNGKVVALVEADGESIYLNSQSDLFDLSKLASLALDHLRSTERS
ncbi:hypothetical protein [Paracoccus jiaweipingae]|uniref:hypothetical protein n=1 Tax=unclassified Paracoccus (in: a-proteobacteria) TaxID=2688777 RepID=UPI0037990FCE